MALLHANLSMNSEKSDVTKYSVTPRGDDSGYRRRGLSAENPPLGL
jgi:hypothetical protein